MSRSDTFVGLSPAALKIVEGCGQKHRTGNEEVVAAVIGSDCRYTIGVRIPGLEPCVKVEEGLYTASGMYNNEYPLSKYTLRDGTFLIEIQQQCIWDGGPTIYTCLTDGSGIPIKKSEWTGEELRQRHPEYFDEVVSYD